MHYSVLDYELTHNEMLRLSAAARDVTTSFKTYRIWSCLRLFNDKVFLNTSLDEGYKKETSF